MSNTTRTELYHNNEFKIVSVNNETTGIVSRLILIYDVDLHCATILTYYPHSDTYDATFCHAFNRAWAVLSATYSREKISTLWVDPMAGVRFLKGLKDYLKAKRNLVRFADNMYKEKIRKNIF